MSNLTSKTVEQNKSEIVITQHFSQEVFFDLMTDSYPTNSFFRNKQQFFQLLTNLVKKKGPSCGPCKASGDELRAVGQNCVAVCTGEQASATNMIQKNSSHF